MLTFGSVCSGIEAASVAWHPLGWRAVWFAEVDRAASEVLAYRFPNVPNHGDMTKLAAMVRAREIPAPDVLVGGTPCQSFSVAGLRLGLADARGQLTIAFIDLANAIDEVRAADGKPPVIIVWENVPGVLTHADNPLGCFLAGLAGDDDALEPGPRPESGRSAAYWTWDKKTRDHRAKWPNAGCAAGPERAVAWRVLDSQWFGLAQRRRRVFVVASARQGFDPAALLLEFDGVRRDSAPSREAGEGVAGTLDGRTQGGGFPGTDGACAGHDVPCNGQLRESALGVDLQNANLGADVIGTLDSEGQSRFPAVLQPVTVVHGTQDPISSDDLALPLARNSGQENVVAYAVTLRGREGGGTAELGDDVAGCPQASGGGGDKAHVLAPVDVLPFDTTQITSPGNDSAPRAGDPCHPLAAGAHPPAVCVTGSVTHTLKAEGFDASEDDTGRGQPIVPATMYSIMPMNSGRDYKAREVDVAQPLMSAGPVGGNQGGDYLLEPVQMAVRRLMPVECERLQGFPDNWTLVPTGKHGKPAADGPRYKQCGNSMATHVMHWIGARIAAALGRNGGPPIDDSFDSLLGDSFEELLA